jgi:hypothetical protein
MERAPFRSLFGWTSSAMPGGRSIGGGRTIGWRTAICRSDDASDAAVPADERRTPSVEHGGGTDPGAELLRSGRIQNLLVRVNDSLGLLLPLS